MECPGDALIDLDAVAANTDRAIFETGIIPGDADVNTYCQASAFDDPQNCASYMDKARFE